MTSGWPGKARAIPPGVALAALIAIAAAGLANHYGAPAMLCATLDHAPAQAVFLIGATIQDVAQVLGAGHSVSEETGDVATFVKLQRVALQPPGRRRNRWIFPVEVFGRASVKRMDRGYL